MRQHCYIWFISGLQVTNLHQKSNNKMGRMSWYYTSSCFHTSMHKQLVRWSIPDCSDTHIPPLCLPASLHKLVKSLDSKASKQSTCYLCQCCGPHSAFVRREFVPLFKCFGHTFKSEVRITLYFFYFVVFFALCIPLLIVEFTCMYTIQHCSLNLFLHCDEHASRPQSISHAPASHHSNLVSFSCFLNLPAETMAVNSKFSISVRMSQWHRAEKMFMFVQHCHAL